LQDSIKLPQKFEISVFAKDLGNARMLAVTSDSSILVTCPKQGEVIALKDSNQDGTRDTPKSIISSLPNVHGITLYKNTLYFTTPEKVFKTLFKNSFTSNLLEIVDLPSGGRHPDKTMRIGPDNQLYIRTCQPKFPQAL
jgi:glucose/arabinose dehydrogenase